MPNRVSLPLLPATTARRITPTDVSQFVRLDQCERFLRLRLAERAGHDFMESYGVSLQRIPPLMSLSGRTFESAVENQLSQRFRCVQFAPRYNSSHNRSANNAEIINEIRNLQPGQTVLLFQTRLEVVLSQWQLRGDVDLIKLSRSFDGHLDVLIADLKSTAEVKVEHRLQVAFYYQMIAELLQQADLTPSKLRIGILFRPPVDPCPEETAEATPRRQAAQAEFMLTDFLLEIVADPDAYLRSACDLVLEPTSTAQRVADCDLDDLPYCLSFKCDGCLYTEFCMKSSAAAEDLSLLPYINSTEKEALKRNGVSTIDSLATLKQFATDNDFHLVPTPGREQHVKQLASTWPVGPRLDELIHRAKSYRQSVRCDGSRSLAFIPDKGNSSLPVSRPDLNPNLIWLYLDAQQDPLEGRVYLLGALAVACEDGVPVARRSVVRMTEGPPNSSVKERDLFVVWTRELLVAVVEIASSTLSEGKKVPIHLVFFDRYEQRLMLEGLARNFPAMLEKTPPLYDFLTQIAAFDSPIASFLDEEVRTFKNFPMTCQSLQSLATYLKFDWNHPYRFRDLFRARLFDYLGKIDIDGVNEWYTRRARFGSSIPPEYAYAAWKQLPDPAPGCSDEFVDFRAVTRELLLAFQARRLEAIAHVAAKISGNPNTKKTAFQLPELVGFEDKARHLAGALDEFVRIERLVSLVEWKSIRHMQPEQRVLKGECLLVRYLEADQESGVAEQNRENERRRLKKEQLEAEFRSKNPDKTVRLTKEQKAECQWSSDGLRLKLRVETTGIDCDLDEMLLLSTLRDNEIIVIMPRLTVDERLPPDQQKPFTPTPKQLLYGQRAKLIHVKPTVKDDTGRVTAAMAEIALMDSFGNHNTTPFVFSSNNRNLTDGELYTLDPCPNEWFAYWCSKVVGGLCNGNSNALYNRLATPPKPDDISEAIPSPPQSTHYPVSTGQQAFLAGLDAFNALNLLHDFEPSKREFIAKHATTPILLVQGPPGTGKSYSTAFAVFARLQEAMWTGSGMSVGERGSPSLSPKSQTGRKCRVFLSCKTHAATDVLMTNVVEVQKKLRQLQSANPRLFDTHFDRRILDVPIYRIVSKEAAALPDSVISLPKERDRPKGTPKNTTLLDGLKYAIVATTPGGVYDLVKDDLFAYPLCELLVLDEASQMNLPEALMAALALQPDAPIIVVGDHRQMPPIVKHDWDKETRRTFRQYQAYRSLFDTLRLQTPTPPIIRFEESFRLHGAMAEFLRREVYHQDGIAYRSRKMEQLPLFAHDDNFVAAVLHPDYPLVVVVHDEHNSQVRNPFEQNLIGPILRTLADSTKYGLNPLDGLGVVVPHRAQRAALQQAFPELAVSDAETGLSIQSAVDTVERFQGGERKVVMVSATESDRGYLLASAGFLLDPRRLTVAVSRAKQKMILVASRSVFSLFSPDEDTFANALLWKNLLNRTCVYELWSGSCQGVAVTVWGGC
ncbi:MAG: DNA helicase [Planctomycetia bacterium]|nr:DNA helicase [Planctomycetia bacterium]